MADLATATEVLGAMITPALLISASGTLVLSTSNRLSRVVDRVRVLAKDAEALTLTDSERPQAAKRALISSQLHSLAARAMILRSALAALYTAVGFLVATSIGVGVLTTLHVSAGWIAILLAMLGACALLWGSVLLVREGRMALGSTLEEMSYVRGLISSLPAHGEKALGRAP
jgi:predicted phage tail protein